MVMVVIPSTVVPPAVIPPVVVRSAVKRRVSRVIPRVVSGIDIERRVPGRVVPGLRVRIIVRGRGVVRPADVARSGVDLHATAGVLSPRLTRLSTKTRERQGGNARQQKLTHRNLSSGDG